MSEKDKDWNKLCELANEILNSKKESTLKKFCWFPIRMSILVILFVIGTVLGIAGRMYDSCTKK